MGRQSRRRTAAGPGRSRTGEFTRTVDNAERDAHAARLRAGNLSFREIAEQLGYLDESGARRAVQRALAAVPVDAVEELRALENARLDHLLEKLAAGIDKGDVASIETARKISESRRKLYSADGPIEVNITQTTQQDLAIQDLISTAKARATAEKAQIAGD